MIQNYVGEDVTYAEAQTGCNINGVDFKNYNTRPAFVGSLARPSGLIEILRQFGARLRRHHRHMAVIGMRQPEDDGLARVLEQRDLIGREAKPHPMHR